MRRTIGILCVAATAAGCGGGDGGGGELSRAEFSAQGSKICREGAAETRRLIQQEATKPEVQGMSRQEQQLHLASAGMPAMERALDRIEELNAPEEYEPHVEKLVQGMRDVMDLFDELKGKPSEAQAAAAAGRLRKLQEQTRSAARASGLEICLPENS